MDQISDRRFSMGVPVSARRRWERSFFAARAVADRGFLMFCASSRIDVRELVLLQKLLVPAQQRVARDHEHVRACRARGGASRGRAPSTPRP
jgi:hypothetical protein